jgi:hypothetical protein
MKLRNNGGSFIVIFSGKDYPVPSGEFEVFSDQLGYFILGRAAKWGKDVISVDEKKMEDIRPDIKEVEVKIVEPVEEVIVDAVEVLTSGTVTKTKTKIKEVETK